jgi:hypothetical protein
MAQSKGAEPTRENICLFEDLIDTLSFAGVREPWFPEAAVRWAKLSPQREDRFFLEALRGRAKLSDASPYQKTEVQWGTTNDLHLASRIIYPEPTPRWAQAVSSALWEGALNSNALIGTPRYANSVKHAPDIELRYCHCLGGDATFSALMEQRIRPVLPEHQVWRFWNKLSEAKPSEAWVTPPGLRRLILDHTEPVVVRIKDKTPAEIVAAAVAKAKQQLKPLSEEAARLRVRTNVLLNKWDKDGNELLPGTLYEGSLDFEDAQKTKKPQQPTL